MSEREPISRVSEREPRVTAAALARCATRAAALVWRSAPLHVLGYLAVTVVGAAVPVTVAWLTKAVLDGVAHRQTGALLAPAIAIAVAGTAAAAATHAGQYLRAEVDRRAALDAKDELFAAVSRFTGLDRFETPAFLDRLRLAQQSASNPGRLVDTALSAARSAVTVTGFVASLALVNTAFTALVLLSALPALLIELRLSRQRAAMLWRIGPAERREFFYARLMSTVDAAKEIRLFDLGAFLRLRMLTELRTANAARRRMDRRELLVQGGLAGASAVVAGAGLVWAITAAGQGRLGVGDVSMFAAALAGVQAALSGLVGSGVMAYEHLLTFHHHVEIVDAAPEPSHRPASLAPLRRGIELRDVWFRYGPDHPWILRGVDLFIPYGETVALVGRNGAGKSTLVKLLCRFYDPTRGTILWDGTDLRDVPPEALRARIGATFQDFVSYELTATDNIAVGDLPAAADRTRIERAARDAGVHDTLTALPHGYRTLLSRGFPLEEEGEDEEGPDSGASLSGASLSGVSLSGGQWQRLALARAFLRRDRDLMILDEPSSGLDPEAEHEVHRRLAELRSGRTSVVVSHRLGAVRDAGRIVVLADGVVIETGTHAGLLAAGGTYARLFDRQAAGYRDDAEPATAEATGPSR
ncbi:ABC transporter ATP-binding protein [Nonomuraea roseoviolacea]|uniref:ATP-binding cassette subfamily B protein n=1 Tax=Nonomuraea roseoviolacea subsp. carminata TaxID=160689 RepID=A0ABT1JY07_9ACTN|nr:ABC transporter ATP-binding protein [Nonomuraea roseoviolacea]MCP2346636.1 ATP-binding cassette subfamily B protein [Nonomuraea roseoviolacea subsp. carminata]